ncbi:MAG: hypothetical protein NZ908_02700 [Candidatus Micrarchaeota archaeon]|nr:hypothetical protein [Candidatus Micrarchaeota archaeon]
MNTTQLSNLHTETTTKPKTPETRTESHKREPRNLFHRWSRVSGLMRHYMITAAVALSLSLSSCGAPNFSTGLCTVDRAYLKSENVHSLTVGSIGDSPNDYKWLAQRGAVIKHRDGVETPISVFTRVRNVIAFYKTDGKWTILQDQFIQSNTRLDICYLHIPIYERYPLLRFKNPDGFPTTSVPVDSPAGQVLTEFARSIQRDRLIGKRIGETPLARYLTIGIDFYAGVFSREQLQSEFKTIAFTEITDLANLRVDGIYELENVLVSKKDEYYSDFPNYQSNFYYKKLTFVMRELRCCLVIENRDGSIRDDWFAFAIERRDDEELDRRLGYPSDRGIASITRREILPGILIKYDMIGYLTY